MLKGNSIRYGAVAIALHWISAVAVLGLLVLGFMAVNAADNAQEASLLRLHVPLGATVLVLTLLRIGWWFFDRRPEEPFGQPRWQTLSAHSVHTVLYLILVLIGSSGIGLLILSGAANVLFFGSQEPLPRFSDYPPMLVHAAAAFVLIALLAVHVGAALYHQFLRHDHLFARMGVGAVKTGRDDRA